MNSYKPILIVIFFLIPFSIYSQNYVFGIQIKNSAVYAEQFNENRSDNYGRSVDVYFPSIYLSNKFIINDYYQIEISPGFFYAGENFQGFDVILFLRRSIDSELFWGAIGSNFHLNWGRSGNNGYAPSAVFINLGVSLGVNLNKTFSFTLSYFKTLSEDYGYSSIHYPENISYPRKLFGVIQAGFEINIFEL